MYHKVVYKFWCFEIDIKKCKWICQGTGALERKLHQNANPANNSPFKTFAQRAPIPVKGLLETN
jgi:hypothetical protein